jgi:uncharacterized protein YciI
MKQQFFMKLNPPRPTFMADMTEEERAVMHRHVAYWTDLLDRGIAIVFGPVFDGNGYGVGVLSVDSEQQLKEILDADPAVQINRSEYHPMQAIFKPVQ